MKQKKTLITFSTREEHEDTSKEPGYFNDQRGLCVDDDNNLYVLRLLQQAIASVLNHEQKEKRRSKVETKFLLLLFIIFQNPFCYVFLLL